METKQRLTTCMQRLQACSPGRPTDRAICPNTLINGRLNLSLAHAYALRGAYTYSQQLSTYILAGLLSTAISIVQPNPASATLYPQCVIPAYHFYSLITSSRKAYVFLSLCVYLLQELVQDFSLVPNTVHRRTTSPLPTRYLVWGAL